nr:MAG TPA: Terminase small subunit [Caudoviricetes sp.]
MARAPDQRVTQAKALYDKGLKLIDIANQLGIPEGTVRSWKNRYNWDCNVAKEKRNVAKTKKNKKQNQEEPSVDEVSSIIDNPELTDKQRLFCVHYIRCFNATKAYQKAYGCSYENAMQNGSRMLRNDKVKEEILRLKQERLNREFLSESDIFQKYMDIAFADITDYMTFGTEEVPVMAMHGPVKIKDPETGEEKPLTKIVNTVRFKDSTEVDGTILSEVKQGKDGASIKLSDRMKALQWLSNHMNMGTEEQKAKVALLQKKIKEDDDGKKDALKKLDDVLKEIGGVI